MPEFIDAHGITIVYDVYPAEGEVRGVVQLLHGVGEHAARYAVTATALAKAGYTVYADDHRGHGRTGMLQHGGDVSMLGRLGPGGLRAALDAVAKLSVIIRTENPGLPLIVFGHSWGSFLTQMLLDRSPELYDAMILSGSALRWPGTLNSGDLNKPWRAPDAMGTEWLSSDLEVGRAALADPLMTQEPLGKLFGPFDTLRIVGRPRKNLGHDVPILLLVGSEDTVGGPRSVHKLAEWYREKSGMTDATTHVYPGIRHEVLNDVTGDQVRQDILGVLGEKVSDPREAASGDEPAIG